LNILKLWGWCMSLCVQLKHLNWLLEIEVYLRRAIVCLFCLSYWHRPNKVTSCHVLGIVGKPLEYDALSWIPNVLTYDGEVIEYWTIISLKIHLNQRQIWVHSWYFWKALGYNEGVLDVLNLRCGSYWILNNFCKWKFN
jgi:hypothetical protein